MVFRNISELEAVKLYYKLQDEGLSNDEIFTEMYAIDCNLDEENEYED